MKAFGESASRFDSLTSKKGGSSVVDDNDEIFNENGDALKRSMNPFAKPSKLIEKHFSSNSYSGDEDWINPFMEPDMKHKPWSIHWTEHDLAAGWVPADVVQEIYNDLREPDETG